METVYLGRKVECTLLSRKYGVGSAVEVRGAH